MSVASGPTDHNVEELAEDIARREDLVKGLNIRPVLDAEPSIEPIGEETDGIGYETAMGDPERPTEDENVAAEPHAVAAE
jgi:hypothetical protein